MKVWDWLKTIPGIVTAVVSTLAAISSILAVVIFYYGDQRYVTREAYVETQDEDQVASDLRDKMQDEALVKVDTKLTGEIQRVAILKADVVTTDMKLVEMERRTRETEEQLKEIKRQQDQLLQQNARLQTTAEHTSRQLDRLTTILEQRLLRPQPSS